MAKITNVDKEHVEVGLKDGGHVLLKCSACRKPLMKIWITRPDEKLGKEAVKWNVKAKCCYCNDYSYEQLIHGGFHYRGYGVDNPEDLENDIAITNVEDTEIDKKNNLLIFKLKKV